MIPFACHLNPCEAARLRCTGDPLDQGRPFHKAKSTFLDCIKSSALDSSVTKVLTGSSELIHSLCEPDTPRRSRHDLKGANGKPESQRALRGGYGSQTGSRTGKESLAFWA